jgi:hyperosmotically inducible protein
MQVVASVLMAALGAAHVAGCATSSDEREQTSSGTSKSSLLEDAALTARVKTALAAAGISPTAVQVTTTQGGIVQLSGFVDNPEQARRAAEIARNVKGVRYVYDDVRVAPRS